MGKWVIKKVNVTWIQHEKLRGLFNENTRTTLNLSLSSDRAHPHSEKSRHDLGIESLAVSVIFGKVDRHARPERRQMVPLIPNFVKHGKTNAQIGVRSQAELV
jgi:hypothetical protein